MRGAAASAKRRAAALRPWAERCGSPAFIAGACQARKRWWPARSVATGSRKTSWGALILLRLLGLAAGRCAGGTRHIPACRGDIRLGEPREGCVAFKTQPAAWMGTISPATVPRGGLAVHPQCHLPRQVCPSADCTSPSASAAACRDTRHRAGRRQASGAACERAGGLCHT
jgi:hypothetical protein